MEFVVFYDLWLGNTQVTSKNRDNILGDGTASYNPNKNELTLSNPAITGEHSFGENNNQTAAIYYGGDNKLTIKGTYHQNSATAQYGFWGCSDLTLSGQYTFSGTECGLYAQELKIEEAQNVSMTGGTEALYCTSLSIGDYKPIDATYSAPYCYDDKGSLAKHVGFVAPDYYSLWVGSIQVNSFNKDNILGDGKASFDPETSTLTLNNPTIPGVTKSSKIFSQLPTITIVGSYHMTEAETLSGIRSDNGTLALDGNFTIMGTGYRINASNGGLIIVGLPICSDGDITLSGDITVLGHLNNSCGGIYSTNGNITFNGGKLFVRSNGSGVCCKEGTFTVNGNVKSVYLKGNEGAIRAFNIVINNNGGQNLHFIQPVSVYFNASKKTVFESDGSLADHIIIGSSGHYNLWLGSMPVTSTNADDIFGDGTASFNPITNTLTLNNPTIDFRATDYVIYTCDRNLTVMGSYNMTKAATNNGIFVKNGNLTLDGNFTIMSKGNWQNDGSSTKITYAPIYCTQNITLGGNITIQGESVPVAVCAEGGITVTYGNIQAKSGYIGTYCQGAFTANGSAESIIIDGSLCSVFTPNFVIDNAEGDPLKIYEPKDARFEPSFKSIYNSDGHIITHLLLRHLQQYNIWLGDTRVTEDSRNDILGDGTASFDPETNTLTLDNPTISGQTNDCAIYAEHIDLTVKGNATVNTTADCAIKVLYGRLTCEGNISLTGNEYALWSTNGLRLGQTFDVTSPNNAKFNQIGKEYTVYESDGNTVAKSVTIQNLDKYRIWLGSEQVTSLNHTDILGDGKAKYDPDTRTLTLNNPTISDTYSNSKIFIQNTDITIKGRYTMNAAESTFGLYISGGRLSLSGDMTFRGNSMGIVTDDYLYLRGNIKAYGGSYTGIQAPKGLTLEHGLMPSRLEMSCSNGAYEGGHIMPAVTLVTPNGGTITNLDETTTRIYNYSGGQEATDVVLEYRYPAHGIGTEDNPYLIRSDDDWNLLAGDIESGMTTAGKYYELLGNITATTMLGTEEFPFNGTFDGRSFLFTLTADISQEDEAFCAPFQYISDATIRNVKTDGSVTGGLDCAGLVGYVSGGTNLIENCKVGTSVSTYLNNCGGVVGHAGSANTTLSGTVFNGNIIGTTRGSSGSGNGLYIDISGAMYAATLIGRSNSDATLTLSGCLDQSGSYQPIGQGTANLTVTNTYYTRADKQNTNIDNWSGLAKLGYRVEGLDVALTLTGTTGVEPDNVIYAAQGETVTFTVNPNYVLYTSTAGTFNQDPNNVSNCTLVMPAENVTILDKNISSFTITLNSGEHGTVTVPQTSMVGAAVFINITPDDYYWIDELTVKDGNNNEIEIEYENLFRYFRMPNSNVTVTATFKKKYSFEDGVLHLICGNFSGGASINSFDPLEIHTVTNPNVTSVVADPGVRFTGYCGGLFQNFSICTSIDLSNVETSTMTAMTGMFAGCSSLTTLNLTGINTAQVTDMSHLFEDCTSLREFDLSALDISNVKGMYLMFDQCGICKLTLPAGMAVTSDMGLRDGWYGKVNNEWIYSGWILLGSNGTVVSTLGTITVQEQERKYAQIPALPVPMTVVWKQMPNDFVLELPDDVDNTETVELWDGVTTNVKLTGRTLYKDGKWNTLCVPFHLGSLEVLNNFGNNVEIMGLETLWQFNENGEAYYGNPSEPEAATFPYKTGYDYMTGTLRLYYLWSDDIYAGTPYILKWANGDNIISPVFENVTIDKTICPVTSNDGKVTFAGTYAPIANTEGILFDSHNTSNKAFQAALQIEEPTYAKHFFAGWYNDAEFTTPTTTMPFADDGTVKLYARFLESTANVTFAKEGFSTYYNSLADAVLPTGMKARIITAKGDGTTLTYQTVADGNTQDNVVPAGTAVMLQVAPSDAVQAVDLSLTAPAASAISQDNMLYGSDASTTTTGGGTGAKYYKLSYNTNSQNLGWYWGANNGAAFQSGAHKAWLALPSSGQNSASRFVALPDYDDNTTDVLFIPYPVAEQEGVWYLIDGTKLNNTPSAPGLYIHNGQTIMIER